MKNEQPWSSLSGGSSRWKNIDDWTLRRYSRHFSRYPQNPANSARDKKTSFVAVAIQEVLNAAVRELNSKVEGGVGDWGQVTTRGAKCQSVQIRTRFLYVEIRTRSIGIESQNLGINCLASPLTKRLPLPRRPFVNSAKDHCLDGFLLMISRNYDTYS
jgi:hypothetical protein